MNLKFKVWDKKNKQMLGVLQTTFHSYNTDLPYLKVGVIGDDGKGDRFNLAMEDVEILQYIGTEDKNKKEIYRGDILRTNEAGWIGAVYFNYGQFYLKDNKGGYSYEPDWNLCTVLGDIFQNKELLEGSK